jgi:hypothetical protein
MCPKETRGHHYFIGAKDSVKKWVFQARHTPLKHPRMFQKMGATVHADRWCSICASAVQFSIGIGTVHTNKQHLKHRKMCTQWVHDCLYDTITEASAVL